MKNLNQQHEVKNIHLQDIGNENESQLRGRTKKNGPKRATAKKTIRKASAGTAAVSESAPRKTKSPARKPVARLLSEGTLFRDSYTETPFGHDDYQLRQEMGFDRFVDEDLNSPFSVDSSRNLSMELDEDNVHGTYSDQQLVQEIRRAVERDSAVSSAAQKIQLTAKNGVVIVKGTVSSEQEQMIIEDKAVALAGFGQVVNQLEVIEDMLE